MTDNIFTEFKNEYVIPSLLDSHLSEAFPDMEFKDRGSKWTSKYHTDGSISHSPDQSYIYKGGTTLCDQNGNKIAIFDFAMKSFNLDFMGTLKALADICNLTLPEPDGQVSRQMAESRAKQDSLSASKKRQMEALYSPSGAAVLKYLKEGRGYTDEVIRKMELGYLSPDEAQRLTEIGEQIPCNIVDFPLSIPYVSKMRLRGFKVRYITPEAQQRYGKAKYRNNKGLNKKMNSLPFLYNAANIKEDVIVVEGELDALHLYVEGKTNVVATSGGSLSEETVSILTESETLKRVIFIPDNDQNGRGYEFVKKSIPVAEDGGLIALVATLPDGYKDVDEYLCKNSIESLNQIIEQAEKGSLWRYTTLLAEAQQKYGEEYLSGKHTAEVEDAVFTLANSIKEEQDRTRILTDFSQIYGVTDIKEALQRRADYLKERQEEVRRDTEAKQIADMANRLVKEGKTKDALTLMGEAASKLKQIGAREKYGDLLHVSTREERLKRFRDKPEPLETSYQFTDGGQEPLPLTLPSGALTIIAAPTSHGKSTLLRNLALDVAKRIKDNKSVLYFTFEESEEDVEAQLVNTYIGKRLHAISHHHPQIESIVDFYRTGNANYIGGSNAEISRDEFIRKELEFSTNYLDSGKIRVFYKDYNLETLIDALEYAVTGAPTKAIFIDYIQILRSEKLARQVRADQLKEICISLKDFSVKYKLPVILAAQLNREAKTPFRMDNVQMAESSDIEKSANTIICVWNSQFKPTTYGDKGLSKDEKEELESLNAKGFVFGNGGKLFIKLTKKRGSRGVGMYSILDFNGYSGKVVENYKPEVKQPEQTSITFDPFLKDEQNDTETPF